MQKLYESLVTLGKNDHVHVDKVDNKKKILKNRHFLLAQSVILLVLPMEVWESTMTTWLLVASLSVNFYFTHCKKYRNFTQFPGVEILWKGTVSTKFLHQEIRWNYSILCSDQVYEFIKNKTQYAYV